MAMYDVPEEQNDSLENLCTKPSTSEEVSQSAWQELFKFLLKVFGHYSSYAQPILFRGALEFIQDTVLEKTLFRGYPGSMYPHYVRTTSAQGPVKAVMGFPEKEFLQRTYLPVTESIEATMEYFVGTVNVLFSFSKGSSTAFERINVPSNQLACTAPWL